MTIWKKGLIVVDFTFRLVETVTTNVTVISMLQIVPPIVSVNIFSFKHVRSLHYLLPSGVCTKFYYVCKRS